MTEDPELDDLLRNWLSNGVSSAPPVVASRAIEETTSYRQSRFPIGGARARRRPTRRVGLALVGGLALVLGLVFVAPRFLPEPFGFGHPPSSRPAKSSAPEALPIPPPTVELLTTKATTYRGEPAIEFTFAISNWRDYPDVLFERARAVPACPGVANASRTWVYVRDSASGTELESFCALRDPARLGELAVTVRTSGTSPVGFYIELTDRLTGEIGRSAPVALALPVRTP